MNKKNKANLPASSQPLLVSVELKTHTGNEDRDHDTGIYVEVTASDGSTMLAECSDRETGGQYGYANNEDHSFSFSPINSGTTKSHGQGFKSRIGI